MNLIFFFSLLKNNNFLSFLFFFDFYILRERPSQHVSCATLAIRSFYLFVILIPWTQQMDEIVTVLRAHKGIPITIHFQSQDTRVHVVYVLSFIFQVKTDS